MTRIRIVLIVSVMLNLFLAGALVAGYASLRAGKGIINAGSLRVAGAELDPVERVAAGELEHGAHRPDQLVSDGQSADRDGLVPAARGRGPPVGRDRSSGGDLDEAETRVEATDDAELQ